jgi:hypothetical protein
MLRLCAVTSTFEQMLCDVLLTDVCRYERALDRMTFTSFGVNDNFNEHLDLVCVRSLVVFAVLNAIVIVYVCAGARRFVEFVAAAAIRRRQAAHTGVAFPCAQRHVAAGARAGHVLV